MIWVARLENSAYAAEPRSTAGAAERSPAEFEQPGAVGTRVGAPALAVAAGLEALAVLEALFAGFLQPEVVGIPATVPSNLAGLAAVDSPVAMGFGLRPVAANRAMAGAVRPARSAPFCSGRAVGALAKKAESRFAAAAPIFRAR